MVLNCGCIDMAELNKTIHIRKGSTEQTVKLYTTQAEVGDAYSYIKVDGVQAYIPLGAENDGRATMGRVKEHTGNLFAILASGKPPYHKDSYTSPGTYTWTCPVGVTTARVTVAGGGGGGIAVYWMLQFPHKVYIGGSGGKGASKTTTLNVTPNHTYTVTVGKGGLPYVSTSNGNYGEKHASNGETSSFGSISASGGQGAYVTTEPLTGYNGASYGSGGAGGSTWNTGATAGGTGWVYVEYGGDI